MTASGMPNPAATGEGVQPGGQGQPAQVNRKGLNTVTSLASGPLPCAADRAQSYGGGHAETFTIPAPKIMWGAGVSARLTPPPL